MLPVTLLAKIAMEERKTSLAEKSKIVHSGDVFPLLNFSHDMPS
jgi:hypothetical protein